MKVRTVYLVPASRPSNVIERFKSSFVFIIGADSSFPGRENKIWSNISLSVMVYLRDTLELVDGLGVKSEVMTGSAKTKET